MTSSGAADAQGGTHASFLDGEWSLTGRGASGRHVRRAHHGLPPEDAYLLCSLCVDLKISEIVDAGEYVVSALLPESVFVA